jgi:Ser/Thr protein kinase RdoA (MazF antagonist)
MTDHDEFYALARQALPAYGIAPDTELDLINLSENATFFVGGGGTGDPAVLRLHRPGYHNEPEIVSELRWAEALRREAGVTTPTAIPATDGRLIVTVQLDGAPRHVVLFHRIPGHEPEPGELDDAFAVLGAVTARMHEHSISWARPADFGRPRWDLATTLGASPVWGSWKQAPDLDDDERLVLQTAADLVTRRLERFGTSRDRFGLIHADLRLANLLVDGDGAAVIDFDDCGDGWFLYDLAAALSFLEHTQQAPALIDSWLTGYRKIRGLSDREEREIPTFVMLRRLMLLAWVGSHQGTELAAELGAEFCRDSVEVAEGYLASTLADRTTNY